MRLVNTTGLHTTLEAMLRSSTASNPAFDTLLHDYSDYHAVLVVLGGFLTAGLLLLSVFSWRRLRRVPRTRTFERRTYRAFALASGTVFLGLALVMAANVSTVLDPRQGFAHVIPAPGAPAPGTERARLHRSAASWIESGRSEVPPLLQRKVDDRLSWQRPKAIISGVLAFALALFSVRLWRRLLGRESGGRGAVAIGATAPVCALVLAAMAIANAQAAFAPLTLTLLYG